MADSSFHPAKATHSVVQWIECRLRLLADVGKTCGLFTGFGLRNIDVMGWTKNLGLATLIDLEIVKAEFPAALQPGVVDQQRCRAVIAVAVNRPMGQDNIRVVVFQNFPKVCVLGAIHFSIAVYLSGKRWPRF